MEKNNSLKLMLSHRYLDLLDCSELIENLKHYSQEMSGIAERNAQNIKNSLDFISEKKSAPQKTAEKKKISNIDKCILLQSKALELGNRNLEFKTFTEKVYFLILFLINTGDIQQGLDNDQKLKRYNQNTLQLKELLCDLLIKSLTSLNQLVSSSLNFDKKNTLVTILGIIRGLQYLISDDQYKTILEEGLEDVLPREQLSELPNTSSVKTILEYSFALIQKVLEIRLEECREGPATTLKSFLRIVRDYFYILTENKDGFVVRRIDENIQSTVLSSAVFKALREEGEEISFEKIPGIFEFETFDILRQTSQTVREFVEGMIPRIENLIKVNSKIGSKFNVEFLSEILWENEQKELLENLKTKYHSGLPQKIEDAFKNEWSDYSEYYIKKIIEDFNIHESFVTISDSLQSYTSKQDNIYKKNLNGEKLHKKIQVAVQVAEQSWRKSIEQYNEFWAIFEKNVFQNSGEVDRLEEIITEALFSKVTEINSEFQKIFFGDTGSNSNKRHILLVALINYLELTYQTLIQIIQDLKKKDFFENLLLSLCDKIYQSIQSDANNLISNKENSELLRILTKLNKKLLQLQLSNITNPKYIDKFRQDLKNDTQRVISEKSSDISSLISSSLAGSSTYPATFYYFLNQEDLQKSAKPIIIQEDEQKVQKRGKEVNIRDTLFLDKLSAEQTDFLTDYTVIPVQKFTLRKKVETMVTKKDRKEVGETITRGVSDDPKGRSIQLPLNPENIDQIAEKAKNIVGGMFKLFKDKK